MPHSLTTDTAYSGCEIMQGTKMSDAKPVAELCSLEIDGAIASLTLRRSEVFNALNVQLISELVEALNWTTQRSVGATQSLHDSEGSQYLRIIVLLVLKRFIRVSDSFLSVLILQMRSRRPV